jgi:hypothetical protein
MTIDERYYEVARPGSLSERLMILARNRMYSDFLDLCAPRPSDSILDVGVSDVLNDGANMIEQLYPYANRITACGLGEAKEFQAAFPTVHYQQIAPRRPLPFADKSFDLAISNAVLEHIGSADNQRRFVAEMVRVAWRVFITVPCRFFPVEHHTGITLAHWWDKTFRLACGLAGKQKWASEDHLRLMSRKRLACVVPEGMPYCIGYTGLKLGPLSSNLYLFLKLRSERERTAVEILRLQG